MQADLSKNWDYENGFYLTCKTERLGKALNQYEAMKKAPVDGDIVEVGVFKGASLMRLAMYRDLLHMNGNVWGFDTFTDFPQSSHDQGFIDNFTSEAGKPLSADEISFYIDSKGIDSVNLVQGNIFDTLPLWVNDARPFISVLNIDVDAYEPTLFALKTLYKRMRKGGVIMFDDYDQCEGARKAIDEFFNNTGVVRPMPFYKAPYIHIVE